MKKAILIRFTILLYVLCFCIFSSENQDADFIFCLQELESFPETIIMKTKRLISYSSAMIE